MQLINLQPHAIIFPDGVRIEPSGSIARVSESLTSVEHPLEQLGIPVVHQQLDKVFISSDEESYAFPDETNGTYYAVSLYVKQALPHRKDLLVPVGQFRDNQGRIIGCQGLAT